MNFYYICHKVLAALIKCIFRIKVVGLENEPTDGSILLCSNHISLWDPVLVGASLKKRQVRFMAKAELFKTPVLGFIIKSLGAFPVERGGRDTGAIRTCISLLKSGECVGIFPQGTRRKDTDARNTEVKAGVGMCAFHAKCDVLPVAVVNKERRMKLFTKTYIVVGKKIDYEKLGITDGDKEQFVRASKLIHERICDLIDEYSGKL